jgi:hypothetical protein
MANQRESRESDMQNQRGNMQSGSNTQQTSTTQQGSKSQMKGGQGAKDKDQMTPSSGRPDDVRDQSRGSGTMGSQQHTNAGSTGTSGGQHSPQSGGAGRSGSSGSQGNS